MDDLPSNVVDVVLRFCDDKKTTAAFRAVNRQWRAVFANSSWPLPPLKLEHPPSITWLQQHAHRLQRVSLRRLEALDPAWVVYLTQLKSLRLEGCRKLEDISSLRYCCSNLHTLQLVNCRNLADLQPLQQLCKLQTLLIDRCFARDLTPLHGHPSLQGLFLSYDCWSVMNLKLPGNLPALKRMRVMAAMQDLSPLSCYAAALQSLELFAVSVCDLGPLSALQHLTELDMHQLQDDLIYDMSPLAALSNLRSIGLIGSDAAIVESAPWPQLADTLTRVDLHSSFVSDLKPLSCLTKLHTLEMTQCKAISSLGPLTGLSSLVELDFTGCKQMQDLRPVLHLKKTGKLKVP